AAEGLEGGKGVALAQFRDLAAVRQLQDLCEQLDLADPSSPKLDVSVPFGMLNRAVHPGFVLIHLLDRGVVEIFAVDERFDGLDETRSKPSVARRGTRLEHRE